MTRPDKPIAPEHISCKVCLKEVPKSEAASAEASDYVLYFCGLDCYQQWTQEEEKATRAAKGETAGADK